MNPLFTKVRRDVSPKKSLAFTAVRLSEQSSTKRTVRCPCDMSVRKGKHKERTIYYFFRLHACASVRLIFMLRTTLRLVNASLHDYDSVIEPKYCSNISYHVINEHLVFTMISFLGLAFFIL